MNESSDAITLRLEGARAKRGVVLADFETFIDSFLAALRDFDRSRRGAPIKTGGRPEARAEAVTSFRLVGFREGSGIVMIEPELAAQGEETEAMVDAEPAQSINLRALLTSVETENDLRRQSRTPLRRRYAPLATTEALPSSYHVATGRQVPPSGCHRRRANRPNPRHKPSAIPNSRDVDFRTPSSG